MRRATPGVWWLSPVGACLLVAPTTLVLAARYDPVRFRTDFRAPKSMTADTELLLLGGILAFLFGALLAQLPGRPLRTGRWPDLTERQRAVMRRAVVPLFTLTMLGYVFFLLSGLRNGFSPGELVQVLLSQDVYDSDLKAVFAPVAGVTTLTQVGIAFTVVAVLLLLQAWDRRVAVLLLVLLIVTVLRAYLLTERLALLEVLVPAVCLLSLAAASRLPKGRRALLSLAPLPLLLLLVGVFAAFEYSRSYTYYADQTGEGLTSFAVGRLSGYYVTAYNNGHLALQHSDYPERLPYATVEGLWTAPLVEQIDAYQRLSGRDYGEEYRRVLDTYGTREFNSPSGLATPFVDFGPFGGGVVLLLLGAGVGALHLSCVRGRPLGLLAYPIAVTGLFELPRFVYWTQGRVVPSALAVIVLVVLLSRPSEKMGQL